MGAGVKSLITGEGMFTVNASTASSAASISEEREEEKISGKLKPLMPILLSR